ncbi:OsmC family protein [Microbacterium awajiense]|uniref:OsmC family protein n=1 Tax=Microbacterium awajiense TaxID=415214 RepID=A0ABP7AGR3_9MICO
MDRDRLRSAQAPLKERYRAEPDAALTPVHAAGVIAEPLTVDVETPAGVVRAALHPATGGDASAGACSGDLLLQALVACAGVTVSAVATSAGIDLGRVRIHAESTFDARGTLGVDRGVDVGIAPVTLVVEVAAELDDPTLARLAAATERYCVVAQSLRHPPVIELRRAHALAAAQAPTR